MCDAIVWEYVTKDQVQQLALKRSPAECKSYLAKIFRQDEQDVKTGFLLDLQMYNYSEHNFNEAQISVLLAIAHLLIQRDMNEHSQTTLSESFQYFQQILLVHSVERSPKNVCVFSPHEVKLIVDYVADSYYRHFEMYKCIYRPFVRTYLVQKTINNVDQPAVPQPLSDAFLHFEDQTIMS